MSRLPHLGRRAGKEKKSKDVSTSCYHSHTAGSPVLVSANWSQTLAQTPPGSNRLPSSRYTRASANPCPQPSHRHHAPDELVRSSLPYPSHQHSSAANAENDVVLHLPRNHPPQSPRTALSYHPPAVTTTSTSGPLAPVIIHETSVSRSPCDPPEHPGSSRTFSCGPTYISSSTAQPVLQRPDSDCQVGSSTPSTSPPRSQRDLMFILQDGSEQNIFENIHHRTYSNPPSKPGSVVSLRRASIPSQGVGLDDPGSDPLRSILVLNNQPSLSSLASSTPSSPLPTAPLSTSSHRGVYPYSHMSDTASIMTGLYSEGRESSMARVPLLGSRSHRGSVSSSLEVFDIASPSTSRRASFLASSQINGTDTSSSLSYERRPSAPHLGTYLASSGLGRASSLNNYPAGQMTSTALEASLEHYRFGNPSAVGTGGSASRQYNSTNNHSRSMDIIGQLSEPLAPWNMRGPSTSRGNRQPSSIPNRPPSRSGSVPIDRERDAPEFVRALSSDTSPYTGSIASSSDSNSHYRSSSGSFASSLRCPLLDPHDSRRQSDAGSIMAMKPLPATSSSYELPIAYQYYNPTGCSSRFGALNGSALGRGTVPGPGPSSLPTSTSTAGGNLFVSLRRRFFPNHPDGRIIKPRVETQLLGELLLALEEYVAAFGRRVKVSAPHQFGSRAGSAAVVVVVAGSGSASATDSGRADTDLVASNLIQATLKAEDEIEDVEEVPQNEDEASDHSTSCSDAKDPFNSEDMSELDPWATADNPSSRYQAEKREQLKGKVPESNSKSEISQAMLSELCEELEYVANEVVDVVPAFGEKLMQGHYGPLAVRANSSSLMASRTHTYSQSSNSAAGPAHYQCQADRRAFNIATASDKHQPQSALQRFFDHEPGGLKDTSDGGSGWWAERLLRDLLEGLVSETVKSASSSTFLSAQPGVRKTAAQMNSVTSYCSPTPLSNQRVNQISTVNLANRPGPHKTMVGKLRPRSEALPRSKEFKLQGIHRELITENSTNNYNGNYGHCGENLKKIPEDQSVGCLSRSEMKYQNEDLELLNEEVEEIEIKKTEEEGVGKLGDLKDDDGLKEDLHQQELLDQGRKRWMAYKANQNHQMSINPVVLKPNHQQRSTRAW